MKAKVIPFSEVMPGDRILLDGTVITAERVTGVLAGTSGFLPMTRVTFDKWRFAEHDPSFLVARIKG